MERSLVFALLLALLPGLFAQCCQKTVDYCPAASVLGTTVERSCVSYGTGHIHTFDGSVYDFHEYGEFWLLTNYATPTSSAGWSVQVRQTDCSSGKTLNVPIDSTTTFQGTCARNYVFLSPSNVPYEFRHDPNAEYLTLLVSGSQQVVSTNYNLASGTSSFAATVTPISYVSASKDLSRPAQVDSNFVVTGLLGSTIRYTLYFYAGGLTTIQLILPSATPFGGSNYGGLCGFVDGCAANDLALRFLPPLASSSYPSPSVVETVQSTSEYVATAGSLSTGRQFINNSANPASWAPYFGSTWRIPSSEERFSDSSRPNARWSRSDYSVSAPGGSCAWLDRWNVPSFLLNACQVDQNLNSDIVSGFNFAALPTVHVFTLYCTYFCSNGRFPFPNKALLPSQCDGICQYPQTGTSKLPDITTVYGHSPDWNVPPPGPFSSPQPSALYTPTLTLAGVYTFEYETTDYCATQKYNVTQTISCSNRISVAPATVIPQIQRLNSYNGIYPSVQVIVDPPAGIVRFQASFVDWPGTGSAPTFSGSDVSFLPTFSPSLLAGEYILRLSFYDGCSIVYQNISINATCGLCPQPSIISDSPIKDFIWNLDFSNPVDGPQLASGAQRFVTKTVTGVTNINVPYTGRLVDYGFQWSVVSDDNTLDIIANPSSGTYLVNRYSNTTVYDFAMQFPNGSVINTSMVDPIWSASTNTISVPLPSLAPLKGPTNAQYGVFPVEREFTISRPGTLTTNVTTNITTWANSTLTKFAVVSSIPCTISLSAPASSITSVTFTPPVTGFNGAASCVGQYNLLFNVSETGCVPWKVDYQKLDVDCGPGPEVSLSCLAQTNYSYSGGFFPPITVDASASMDPYSRLLQYRYGYQQVPAGSARSTITSTAPTATITPDVPGTYLVWVNVSNGCNSNVQVTKIDAYCIGSASQISTGFTVASPITNYDGTLASRRVALTSTATSTATTNLGYLYSFDATTTPNPYNVPFLPNSTILNANTANPTVQMSYRGFFKVYQNVTHGCSQYAQSPVQQIELFCDAVFRPSISGPATVDWVQNSGWPATTFTGTPNEVWNTAPSAANGPAVLQTFWTNSLIANGSQIDQSGNTYGFAPSVSPGGVTNQIMFWANDGCTTNMTTMTVQWRCYPSTLTLTVDATNAPIIVIDGATSNISLLAFNAFTSWRFVSVPVGIYNIPTISDNSIFTPQAVFNASFPGTYIIELTYNDGCANTTAQATYVAPACTTLTLAPKAYLPTVTGEVYTTTWSQNSFGKFDLDGDTSNANRTIYANSYMWIVYDAPAYSIFAPTTNTITTLTSSTSSFNVPDNDTDYNYVQSVTIFTQNVTWVRTSVTLAPVTSNQKLFPSCILPDIAGSYKLGLLVWDNCQFVVSNITLNAVCGPAPMPMLTVHERVGFNNNTEPNYVLRNFSDMTNNNSYTVKLSRSAPRRVVLDARNSIGYTNSKLTYYWAWNYPDPRANTTAAQDDIETPYASTSAVVLQAIGQYHLTLTVHDGCQYTFLNFTLTATCAEPSASIQPGSVVTDGSSVASIRLFGGDVTSCSQNSWVLSNFSADSRFSQSGVTSAASNVKPSILIIFAVAALLSKMFA